MVNDKRFAADLVLAHEAKFFEAAVHAVGQIVTDDKEGAAGHLYGLKGLRLVLELFRVS